MIMKKTTRKLMDNTTAFKVISVKNSEGSNIEIRQYWTNGGVYGPQVVTVIFNYPDFFEHKTSGCGYCKTSDGLEWAWSKLGIRPANTKENDGRLNDYHVGGNFYRVENIA